VTENKKHSNIIRPPIRRADDGLSLSVIGLAHDFLSGRSYQNLSCLKSFA
jgi:hypothetical protein